MGGACLRRRRKHPGTPLARGPTWLVEGGGGPGRRWSRCARPGPTGPDSKEDSKTDLIFEFT
jgi:hypothetical protein